ncbi:hypothetical protein E1211_20610 [Micromonospora sp. 15K316]|uniref:hypothetical protein n=1 Tax=Micromonospora sp. 15K316 TaxID=2530376 RepID=UPI00104C696A|nr:hypothetical protein [Micromonospora sp. 15K316]TDC32543.1 hypothetical protein E1211_20610 [Micromonospora sp. 15K316]
MTGTLRLYADYRQLHLFDEASAANLEEAWTDTVEHTQFSVVTDAAVVVTMSSADVLVDVEVLDHPPQSDLERYDHVVEGSLDVPSGRLVVMGCSDYAPDAPRFDLTPGSVRVRVSKSNLQAAKDAGEHSDEDGATTERVRLQVWPAAPAQTEVLRQWPAAPDPGCA